MVFVWQIKEGAVEFTSDEYRLMRWWLRTLIKECPRTCSFLNDFDLDNLKFFWAKNLTLSNGILGAWSLTDKDTIYLCNQPEHNVTTAGMRPDGSSRSGCIKDYRLAWKFMHMIDESITITTIHELIHKFQYKTAPVFYMINRFVTLFADRIPFIEKIGIEYDARVNSETEELHNFVTEFSGAYSAFMSAIGTHTPESPSNFLYKCYRGLGDYEPSYPKHIQDLVDEAMSSINK